MQLRTSGIAAGVACLMLLSSGTAAADPADSPTGADVPTTAAPGDAIPLITGDRVLLRPDGLFQVDPGPGREHIGFESPSTADGSGDLMIVPTDAAAPLAEGVLDERLFNVSALARQGYLGADALPVLRQDDTGTEDRKVSASDTAGFWEELSGDELAASGTGSPEWKLWLDDATGRSEALPGPDDPIAAEEPPADAQQVTVHFTAPGGGAPDQAQLNLQNVTTRKVFYLRPDEGGATATGMIPAGEYTGLAHQRVEPARGHDGRFSLTFHELTVTNQAVETSIGGELEPIEFRVERSGARMHSVEMKLQANLPGTGSGMSFTSIQTGQWDVYSAPTGDADVLFAVRPTLTGPPEANGDTDYSYHLVFHGDDGVPDDLSFDVEDGDLARRTSEYHSRGDAFSVLRNSYGKVSSGHDSGYVIPGESVSAPGTREEYYTADPSVEWFQIAEFGDPVSPDTMVRYGGFYEPGKRKVVWGGAPVGPGLIPDRFSYAMSRNGNRIAGITPLCSGPDPAEAAWSRSGVTGSATLSRDGVVVGSHTSRPESHNFSLPAGDAGDYTLTVETSRSVPWSDLGGSVSAEWTFHSEPTDARTPLDLQAIGMTVPGVKNGYVSARLPQLITLDVHRQGADAETRKLGFQVSYDDGETWRKVPLLRDKDRAVTVLKHPRDAEFVSVRLSATDDAGNSVTQTTIRSYGLK